MNVFKIDGKTSTLHAVRYIMGAVFFITILALMIPILIFSLFVDLCTKVTGHYPYTVHHYFTKLFYNIEEVTDRYLAWVTKITTTEKEKMWNELTQVIKED